MASLKDKLAMVVSLCALCGMVVTACTVYARGEFVPRSELDDRLAGLEHKIDKIYDYVLTHK